MNHTEDDKILKKLYQQSQQQLPPESLDDLILQQASQSHHREKRGRNWRPWLAAASVVLVVPLIWVMTQSPNMLETTDSRPTINLPQPNNQSTAAKPAPMAADATPPAAEPEPPVKAAEVPVTTMPEASTMADEQAPQANRIQVTGSRLRTDPALAQKQLLIEQLTGGKRTFNPEKLNPDLALLYKQFEQHLKSGQLELAEEILDEMYDAYPEYDFEPLWLKLEALLESKDNQ